MTSEEPTGTGAPVAGMQRGPIGLLTTSHFFNDVNQGVVPAFIPFLVAERGLSYAAAGGVVMAATVLSSVVQPVFGWLSDSRSHPWFMSGGVFLAGLGIALAGIAPTYPWILAAVALSGVGVAAYHPEAARTANLVAGSRKATALSVFAVGGNAGYAAGPLLATPLFVALGVAGSPLLLIPSALTAFVLMRWTRTIHLDEPQARSDEPRVTAVRRGRGSGLDWGAFTRLTIVVVARSTAFFTLVSFVPLYWIQVLGASPALGNTALTLMLFSGVAGTLGGGWIADRFGSRRVVGGGLLLVAGLVVVLVVLVPGPGWDVATVMLLGVGLYLPFGVMTRMGQAYLWRRLGTASGVTLGLSMSVGGLTAPLFGAYADATSLSTALTLLAVVPLAGAALTLTLPAVDNGRSPRPAADGQDEAGDDSA